MLTSAGFEAHVAKLLNPAATPEERRLLAAEVRDSIELVHSAEYGVFLHHFFPAFTAVLGKLTQPQTVDNAVHKTRSIVLEILNRLPANEILRPRVRELLRLVMDVLRTDNEDNAVTAIHIIFDLHKTFRPSLQPEVQPFLDFVRDLYTKFNGTVARAFHVAQGQLPPSSIRPSTQSFKVVTECPLIVMFLFQLYPAFKVQNIPILLPIMVKAIEVEIPPPQVAQAPKSHFHEFISAQVKTVSFLSFLLKEFQDKMKAHEQSIPKSVVQLLKACPGDAVAIRKELLVATRHILATPFRAGFFGQIDLLLTESVLVGTGRAAYATLRPLAYSFLAELVHFVRLDLTLDQLSRIIYLFSANVHDRTLSYAVQTTSMRLLLNLIEGILKKKDQEIRTRQLLVRIMNTIVTKYDAVASQVPHLLKSAEEVGVVDPVLTGAPLSMDPSGDPFKEISDCKHLIKTLTLGLKTVVWSAINIRYSGPGQPAPGVRGVLPGLAAGGAKAGVAPASGAAGPSGVPSNPKPGPGSADLQPRATGLLENECELLSDLLASARQCFRLYGSQVGFPSDELSAKSGRQDTGGSGSTLPRPTGFGVLPAQLNLEEKEILETFAHVFTVLDVRSFQDVFGLRMGELFELVVENEAALAIPQHFLTNGQISKYFADILLNFLVSSMSELGTPISDDISKEHGASTRTDARDRRAEGLLRLFRILFASVTLFPNNEPVLKPHLSAIVRNCLSYAGKCEDPSNYLQLLRVLFKSLTNGKHEMQFELLYRDFMPLVEPVFDGLLELYNGPHRLEHKDLIVELCLSVPARPSTIFPYLDKQLKPMVWALSGSRENVLYGLRALEFWVDTLQPSYIDGLLRDVEPDFSETLSRLAKPSPGSSGATIGTLALKILGKLGERSRTAVGKMSNPEPRDNPDVTLELQFAWAGGSSFSMETGSIARMAAASLMDEATTGSTRSQILAQKKHSWRLLRAFIVPFLGITDDWSALGESGASDGDVVMDGSSAKPKPWHGCRDIHKFADFSDAAPALGQRTRALHRAEHALLRTILTALLAAAKLSDTQEAPSSVGLPREASLDSSSEPYGPYGKKENDSPEAFALGLCRYFALLHSKGIGGSNKKRGGIDSELSTKSGVAPSGFLDADVFLEAVIDVLSREERSHAEAGYRCLVEYVEALTEYSGLSKVLKSRLEPTAASAVNAELKAGSVPNAGESSGGKDLQDGNAGEPNTTSNPPPKTKPEPCVAAGVPASSVAPEAPNPSALAKNPSIMTGPGVQNGASAGNSGKPFPSSSVVASVPRALSSLVERLCHCCYERSWYSKWAGAAGFGALITRVPVEVFSVRTSASYEAHVVRALMFVVRDLSNDVRVATTTAARRSLKALLELCHQKGPMSTSKEWHDRAIRDVTVCITVELTSQSSGARDAAKEALRVLGKTMKCPVADVVRLAKDHILRAFQQRALRQLSFPVQVGYMDAVTFCLELETPVFGEELFKSPLKEMFLMGVLATTEDGTIEKLTEAEEGVRNKLVENKMIGMKTVYHLPQLRRRAVDFLRCISFKCPHLLFTEANEELLRRVISSFFKCIQSRDMEVVSHAKEGLKVAIANHAKPKELLQTNLRPVLTTLADHKKLSLSYLEGLARVLELLSRWFSVQLGDKLLEHLEKWTEPEQLAAVKKWAPGTENLVGAAILHLFHLLPSPASKFLVPIVNMVLRLEAVLAVAGPGVAHLGLAGPGAASTSPYREPLLKFCNAHTAIAVQYFLGHLANPAIRRLFIVLLRADGAGPLCTEVGSNPQRLMDCTFGAPENNKSNGVFAFTGVVVVDVMLKRNPSWLALNPAVMEKLIAHWKSHDRLARISKEEEHLPLEQLREPRIMADCLIRHCRRHPNDVQLLFHLLQVFSARTLIDYTFVKDFYVDVVSATYTVANKRAILNYFLDFFVDRTVPQERKVHALQFLVVPMLSHHLQTRKDAQQGERGTAGPSGGASSSGKGQPAQSGRAGSSNLATGSVAMQHVSGGLVDATGGAVVSSRASTSGSGDAASQPAGGSSIAPGNVGPAREAQDASDVDQDGVLDDKILPRIMVDLLDQPDDVLRQYDEPLSAELLQLATLLVQYMPNKLAQHRKELIKFGWNHLKREDSVAKQWAFVNVSRFFEAYQAPDKIILQVYVALLRTCQPDGRHLVRRALDILTPALPKRLEHNKGDHKYPIWIRYTKKILLEEGHSLPHLVHIWQLIVRHSDLFYVARAQFVPIMVNSLTRIGLGPSSSSENRRLALDLADLIISWERKRVSGSRNDSRVAASVGTKRSRQDGSSGGAAPAAAPVTSAAGAQAQASSNVVSKADEAGEGRPSKLQKTGEGVAVPSPSQVAGNGISGRSDKQAAPGPVAGAGPHDADDFQPGAGMVDVVVNFLAQVAFRQMDRREGHIITKRSISLLGSALELWPRTVVRLGFLEKFFDSGSADRVAAQTAPPAQSANVSHRGRGGAFVAGGSESRGGASHDAAHRADAQAAERSAARANALTVALEMSSVLIEKQGLGFVSSNGGAIRAMVNPAVTDRNVSVASLFAKLLAKLLHLCPPPTVRRPTPLAAGTANAPSGVAAGGRLPVSGAGRGGAVTGALHAAHVGGPAQVPGAGRGAGNAASVAPSSLKKQGSTVGANSSGQPQAPEVSGPVAGAQRLRTTSGVSVPGAASLAATSGSSASAGPAAPGKHAAPGMPVRSQVDVMYSLLDTAVERCLKGDVQNVHCGLIVLQVLVENRPEEFSRYQDLVVKALHRMAKESLSMSQSGAGGSSGPVAGSGQSVTAKEKAGNSNVSGPGPNSNVPSRAPGGHVQAPGASDSASPGTAHAARTSDGSSDGQALIIGLTLAGAHITGLEALQRRTLFQVFFALIERCVQVKVLLEIVRIIGTWVRWRPPKKDDKVPKDSIFGREPLAAKDKVTLLLKMTIFERITGLGSEALMAAYLNIILAVFGGGQDPTERRPELLQKLERAFMIGLKTDIAPIRKKFFNLFDAAADRSPFERLRYALVKQDWEPLADSFWVRQALELVLAVVESNDKVVSGRPLASLPSLRWKGRELPQQTGAGSEANENLPSVMNVGASASLGPLSTTPTARGGYDHVLNGFLSNVVDVRTGNVMFALRELMHLDVEVARSAWLCVFPNVWSLIPASERIGMETGLSVLFAKEYHAAQMSWNRSSIVTLLEGASRCRPLPPLRPEVILHIGVRWGAWHVSAPYLESRATILKQQLAAAEKLEDPRIGAKIEGELELVLDASTVLYRQLDEVDFFAGIWKGRCAAPVTTVALCLEQQARFPEAQNHYADLNGQYAGDVDGDTLALTSIGGGSLGKDPSRASDTGRAAVGRAEVCLWEARWIECARELCQWDVLTEFSRTCLHTELLHDCLWRVPEWAALKELLARRPIEDSPELKIYESYMRLQENKIEMADTFIQQGMHRALEQYCALPVGTGSRMTSSTLVLFQQFVELQESSRILSELTALSRHGTVSVNVEAKIDTLKTILNTWRERMPAQHESLRVWSNIMTWRNHVHSIVVTVLESLKTVASQTVQASQNQLPGNNKANQAQGAQGQNVDLAQARAAAAIANALTNQQALIMGVNETAWGVHRFARACRKQGLPSVALTALQHLYPFGTMELTEYFVKTKETAKSYLASPSGIDHPYLHGLNELNRCNMDHFNAQQKAQLFNMKGKFQKALGQDNDVVDSFSTALSTSSDVGAAWVSWALHSDDMLEKSLAEAPQSLDMVDVTDVSTRPEFAWREAAVNCYLHAVKYGSGKGRRFIPRTLRLLALDLNARTLLEQSDGAPSNSATAGKESSVEAPADEARREAVSMPGKSLDATALPESPPKRIGVYGVFVTFVEVLPPWVWLPWVAQLVPMLGRAEVFVARAILVRIVQQYPQAAFFSLRAYLEERKMIDRPVRNFVAEALQSSRPDTNPLLPGAGGAAAKQVAATQAAAQQARVRLNAAQVEHKRAVEELTAKAGTSERATLEQRVGQLRAEVENRRRGFENAVRAYQVAAQQKKNAVTQASDSGSSGENMTGSLNANASKGGNGAKVSGSGSPAPSAGSSMQGVSRGVVSSEQGSLKAHGQDASSVASTPTSTPTAPEGGATPNAKSGYQRSGAGDTPKREGSQGEGIAPTPEQTRGVAQGSGPSPASSSRGQKHNKGHAQGQPQPQGRNVVSQPGGPVNPRTPYEHADLVMARLVRFHQSVYIEMERIAQDLAQRLKPQQEEQLLGLVNALLQRCYPLSVQQGKEVAPSLRSALEEVSRMCFGTTAAGERVSAPAPSVKIQQGIVDLKAPFEAELAPQTAVDFPTRIEPFIARLRRWKNIFQRRVDAMPEVLRLESLSRHLIEVQNSDVELFGQYLAAEAVEPHTSFHVKIDRFSANARVVRRHSGAARGVTIIGNNGRKYHFVLETSMNAASQPTEERASQLCRLLNATFLARNAEASRRNLQVEVPMLIPTGQHTRLLSDDPDTSSIIEGLERFLESEGGNIDDPLMAFRNLAAEAYNRRHAKNPQQNGGRKDSIAARIEAYRSVCNSHVPDSCLSDWVAASLSSPTAHFAFRKKFAESLGTSSLVNFALAIGARRPQNVMFSWISGAVSNLHMRPLVSQRGVLECDEAVPFRLTRNIERLLGPYGIHGPLFGAMSVAMRALNDDSRVLKAYLDLLVRDELLTWAAARPDAQKNPNGGPNGGTSAGNASGASAAGVRGASAANATTAASTAIATTAAGSTGAAATTGATAGAGAASTKGEKGDEGGNSGSGDTGNAAAKRPTDFVVIEENLVASVDGALRRLSSARPAEAGNETPPNDEPGPGSSSDVEGGRVPITPNGADLDDVSFAIYNLIDRALRPENLAQMDSSWQSWF